MEVEFLQEQLALKAESTAWWRGEKAEQYPDDARNARSQRALDHLATRLREMPEGHPLFLRLWKALYGLQAVDDIEPRDFLDYVEAESQAFSRYGFDGPEEGKPEEFLKNLISDFESIP